jgi:hypothetical protein
MIEPEPGQPSKPDDLTLIVYRQAVGSPRRHSG